VAKKRPTVKEIASRAGVYIGTVDRVLHGRGGVSAATRARVADIIDALGYTPDLLARQLKLNRTYHLRVLIPQADQDSGYWRLCREGIEEAAKNLRAYRTEVCIEEFDRSDRPAFRRILESVAADPGDGLLVAPVLPDELKPALVRLGTDIPCVFFDGTLEGTSPCCSVGQDALAAGRLAGRMMALLAPDASTLLAITTHAEDRHLRQRIEGFLAFFDGSGTSRHPEILVRECPDLERRETREPFLSAIFEERPDTGGILVVEASGHFVGEWLAGAGLKEGRPLVTWDLVPDNETALGSGAVDCVISQRPFEQGRLGLEALFSAVTTGATGPDRIDLPMEIWLRENLPFSGRAEKRSWHETGTR
jgi:LacI family transcriptional regulator